MKKVNVGLVLAYVIVPIILAAVVAVVMGSPLGQNSRDSQIAMFILALMLGYLLTFVVISRIIFSGSARRFKVFCQNNGCKFDYFFEGHTTYVAVDTKNRTMGLLFKLNPSSPYIVSLDVVEDASYNNGVSKLSFGGTKSVSFSFCVDGKAITVWTLNTNTTCSLKSPIVIEAIKQADKMVAAING